PLQKFRRATLRSQDYVVLEATTGESGLKRAAAERPDLIILDLGLPDIDGTEVTRRLREWTATPIIVISARGKELDKVAALDAGADDYLTKPFGVGELLARLRVAIRHREALARHADEPVIEVDALRIDLARREVTVGERAVRLTATEYRLLVLLARNAGRVLTHRQILQEVWGPGHAGETHTVRVHMAELRKKIEENAARPKILITEPGVGYRLRDHL